MQLLKSLGFRATLLLIAAAVVALGAWLSFPIPGTDIPQTGQTVAVLALGGLLGARLGTASVLLYLLLGALGLPIYSDGGSGWSVLFGSSVGYFFGFVVAAGLMGALCARTPAQWVGKISVLVAAMALGHGVILLCGFIGLSLNTDPMTAWQQGVQPFLYGGLVKSVIATMLILMVEPIKPQLKAQFQ